ncbi:hypothetical protein [Roseivivax sp. CAU 1761]
MQVILHTGAHFTDEDRIWRGLNRNAPDWRAAGIAVPGPGRYRRLLGDAVHALEHDAPAPEAREVLLETILSDDPAQVGRMILCNPNFFGFPAGAFAGGRAYPKAEARIAALRALFAGDDFALFMGLRNPASFLPAMAAARTSSCAELLAGADPLAFRWSDLVARLRSAHPDLPITLWCDEDTPLIWGQVLRELAGLPLDRKIRGAFDRLSEIIAPEGMQRFRAFLAEHRDMTEAQKRRAMSAFLAKYARPDLVEEELDADGWDAALVEDMTQAYEEDVARLAGLEGVRVILP